MKVLKCPQCNSTEIVCEENDYEYDYYNCLNCEFDQIRVNKHTGKIE